MLDPDSEIEFTVIITAYNRRDFLLKSLNSVLSQKLPRSAYEIIVSKDFEDVEIDKIFKEKGARLIYNQKPGIGQRLHECISISRGRIIAFLEDDDMWLDNRLSIVLQEFSNDKKLGYYHNSYLPINEAEKTTKEWIHHKNIKETKRLSQKTDFSQILSDIMRFSPNFNLSSICISRELSLKLMNHLSNFFAAIDLYLFLGAISLNFNIVLDSRKLTKYMIHQSIMNKSGSFAEFQAGSLKVYQQHLESLEIMTEILSNDFIRDIAKSYSSEWAVRICILQGRSKRFTLLKTIMTRAKLFFIRHDYSKYLFAIAIFSFLFPTVTKYSYYFYLKNSLIKYEN